MILVPTLDLSAQVAPKYSNAFLDIGVGARAFGMSNSVAANVSDVTAGYWNPTGLLDINSNFQVGAMHSNYFAGITKYDYAAVGVPIDSSSAMGISFIRFGVDDIPNTTQLIDADGNINYDNITTFSAGDHAFLFSYARKLPVKGLRIGGNAKIVYRKVGSFAKSWGFGLDAAVSYRLHDWRFAAMARDATGTYNAWSFSLDQNMIDVFEQTGNEIPQNGLELTLPTLILAAGRRFQIKDHFSILGELDADISTDRKRNVLLRGNPFSIDPHLGTELSYRQIIFVRAGVGNFQWVRARIGQNEELTFQPNIGLGVQIKNLSIDWAMTDIGDQSAALYSHIFSLKLNIIKQAK